MTSTRGDALRTAVQRARSAAGTAAFGLLERRGYRVLPRHFYSPIPELDELPDELWQRPAPMPGVELDTDAQFSFLERRLAAPIAEWRPAAEPDPRGHAFHLDNPTFGPVDAEVLYAMVRHLRPARVVELGSGASTFVIAEAAERLRAEGQAVDHRIHDPFPGAGSRLRPHEVLPVNRVSATDLPLSEFEALEERDVLFVDTSHTVRTGGEVNRIVLDILPRLAPGVVVHVHDVFLPWEYPRDWIAGGRYFAEQYLLHAFLACNPYFEVVLAAYALARADPERLARTVPRFTPAERPGSFWIRRVTG